MYFRLALVLTVLLRLSAAAAAPFTYDQGSGGSKGKLNTFSSSFAGLFLHLLAVCEPFADPKNGWVRHLVHKGAVHTAVFSCDDGYAIIGQNTITCIDGVWERDPLQCKCTLFILAF